MILGGTELERNCEEGAPSPIKHIIYRLDHVLVVICGIFDLCFGMWDLVP